VVSKIRRSKGKSTLSTFYGKTVVALSGELVWNVVGIVYLCVFRLLIHQVLTDLPAVGSVSIASLRQASL